MTDSTARSDDHYEPSDMEDSDVMTCPYCQGSGLAPEGWDCEECDGIGYWE